MSYIRFGEQGSDVYVYQDANNSLVCCACKFIGDQPVDHDYTCDRRSRMIAHLLRHVKAGHVVPQKAFHSLRSEMRKGAEHDYRTCAVPECDECQVLVDNGLVMACDKCDTPGSTEAAGWQLMPDGRTLCAGCFDKEMNADAAKRLAKYPRNTACILLDDGSGKVKDWFISALPKCDNEATLRAHLAKYNPNAEFIGWAIK